MAKKFKENLNSYVFTSKYVFKEGAPIVYVSHDDNGDWQFLGAENSKEEEDAMVVALSEIIAADPTILTILDLPLGKEATRRFVNDNWLIV